MQEAEPENAQYGRSQETKGQRRTTKTQSTITPPRQHATQTTPALCTGVEPIHLVHGRLRLQATEKMLRNWIHISDIFVRFTVAEHYSLIVID